MTAGLAPRRAAGRLGQDHVVLSIAAGVVALVSYTCTVVMTHLLDTASYAQYAGAQTLLTVVGTAAGALVPLPLAAHVRAHAAGTAPRREAVTFAVGVSIVLGAVAAVAVGAVCASFAPVPVVLAVGVATLLLFAVAPVLGWLQGEGRVVPYTTLVLTQVAVRLLVSVAAVAIGTGVSGAVGGFVAGAAVVIAVGAPALRGDLLRRPGVLRQPARWRETGDVALTQLVIAALVGLDVVLVAALGDGSIAEAGFAALATLAKAPIYVAAGTVLVTFPLLRARPAEADAVLAASLRSFGLLALPAAAVTATAPQDLVGLVLPEAYAAQTSLLPALAVSALAGAVLTVFATVLLALRARARNLVGLLTAAVLLPAALVLGWHLGGVHGLALGGAVGSAGAAVVLGGLAMSRLPARTLRAAAGGTAAAGLLGLVLALLRDHPGWWVVVVLGAVVGVIRLMRTAGGAAC